jgi:hypothetical protein
MNSTEIKVLTTEELKFFKSTFEKMFYQRSLKRQSLCNFPDSYVSNRMQGFSEIMNQSITKQTAIIWVYGTSETETYQQITGYYFLVPRDKTTYDVYVCTDSPHENSFDSEQTINFISDNSSKVIYY